MDIIAITKKTFALLKTNGRKREKPLVIQLPITSRCNSKCKTCNVWKHNESSDIDPEALTKALKDPFFDKVLSVGVNGGEITLVPNFIEIIKSIITLPSIQYIYIISNGLFPSKLYDYTQEAKKVCQQRNVKLHLSLSVDGYGITHDEVRGIPGAFNKTLSILNEFKENHQLYCDSFSIGCTISRFNIGNIKETENFLNKYPFPVEYHLAVPNERIGTYHDYEDYYVLNDEKSRLLAAEFFYTKYIQESNKHEKERYFSTYYFLKNKGTGRLCDCAYLNRDVTIDEKLNLRLCSTASKTIGNLNLESATTLISSKKTRRIKREIQKCCQQCIHYSYHSMTAKGRWIYTQETQKIENSQNIYHKLSNSSTGCMEQLKTKFHSLRLGFRAILNQ